MVRRTWRGDDSTARQRLVDVGEYVLPRGDVTVTTVASSGNLWVTHFTAARSETIASVQTGTGGSGTVAIDATGSWVGVLSWDGVQYSPLVVSVNDPTRWTAQFQSYDTPLYAVNGSGAADLSSPGFRKVAGRRYAFFLLWTGTTQAPSLPSGGGWYSDSMVEPRTNAYIGAQTGPPSGALMAGWFGPDQRRFQGLMKR